MAAKKLRFLQITTPHILRPFAKNANTSLPVAKITAVLLTLLPWPGLVAASESACAPLVHNERSFVVCSFDVRKDSI
ncbi:MAG: hypothetical protein QOF41_1624 [Methylobacteriaceae bacterium]|nr:hypothetical protein [Methylobacteriaceae bacterium]